MEAIKTYLVPNKTTPEFYSLNDHAPLYVSVAVCGDTVCNGDENATNCEDCETAIPDHYCGDGICAQTTVMVHYDPPKVVITM